MKKALLLSALAGTVALYSCSKEGKTTTVTNTVHDTTKTTVTIFASGKINADTLTEGINLIYGSKIVDATFPAASTDAAAPVLDTDYLRTYSVIRSRFLTIYPPNVSGYVAGYYVQIVGAKTYFKVDFPEAESTRRAARNANSRQSSDDNATSRGYGEGYIDSTLVFKLPSSVRGDTFYIKYAAYDESNRVSRPVTAMVVLLPTGNAAMTDSLKGTWKYYSYTSNEASNNGRVFRDWTVDTGYSYSRYYDCNGTTLSVAEQETPYYLAYRKYSNKWEYNLSQYSMVEHRTNTRRDIDLSISSCDAPVYYLRYDNIYDYPGGYSYEAASKKITFIRDNNSNLNLDYSTYYLFELTDTTMILSDTDKEGSDDNSTILYKFIK